MNSMFRKKSSVALLFMSFSRSPKLKSRKGLAKNHLLLDVLDDSGWEAVHEWYHGQVVTK